MKKISKVILILSLFTFFNCGPKEENQAEGDSTESVVVDFKKEFDNIHMDAMGEMTNLASLKSDLEDIIKNSPDLVEERRQQIEKIIKMADAAIKSMMDWMKGIPHDFQNISQEDQKKLLDEAKSIQSEIQDAIKAAKAEVAAAE